MKIFLGADHNGFELKEHLERFLQRSGHEVTDAGDTKLDPNDDFPQFASRVVNGMKASSDKDVRGILLCGSGQGMCMAANRYNGIRAGLCWNVKQARSVRNDDDSNVLCLPARELSEEDAEKIVSAWLTAPFAGAARYKRRLQELDELN